MDIEDFCSPTDDTQGEKEEREAAEHWTRPAIVTLPATLPRVGRVAEKGKGSRDVLEARPGWRGRRVTLYVERKARGAMRLSNIHLPPGAKLAWQCSLYEVDENGRPIAGSFAPFVPRTARREGGERFELPCWFESGRVACFKSTRKGGGTREVCRVYWWLADVRIDPYGPAFLDVYETGEVEEIKRLKRRNAA